MVTVNALLNYCNSVHNSGAVYLWGADGQVGSEDLLDTLKRRHGESHYNGISAKDIEGRFCFDCSGLLTPISGVDMTAQSYYTMCKRKGMIKDIPKNKVCLIFRMEGVKIVHVAVYMGNGKLCEMWNGCDIRNFIPSQWYCYGFPEWLEEQKDTDIPEVPFLIKPVISDVAYYNEPVDGSKRNGYLRKNVLYTIVDISGDYGHLKSGAGWVLLDKTKMNFIEREVKK